MMKLIYALLLSLIYSHAFGADWYFDKDSISISEGGVACSDTGPGTKSQPFCNIFNKIYNYTWNGPAAGETIYIRAGTYTGRTFWIKEGALDNGTSSNPIVIRPYPGETVKFDGQNTADFFINLKGATNNTHDIHFIGPFEAYGYTIFMDGDHITSGFRTNFKFDNWKIHHGSMGLMFRFFQNVVVSNSEFYDLKGFSTGINENVIGVGIKGLLGDARLNDNILIDNCIAHDINDGKGNDNGDADGFWTDQFVDRITIKNSSAYRCSEDGFDTKGRRVTLENLQAFDNGATGIKFWAGNMGIPSTYTATNLLIYDNSETGLKCTGWGSGVDNKITATVDHLTSWGNVEDGVKNKYGTDISDGCNLTIRNSIVGETKTQEINIYSPKTGYAADTNLLNTALYHPGTGNPIVASQCGALTSKYTAAQYLAGLFNSELSATVACGGGYGTLTGSASGPSIIDPSLQSPTPAPEWASIATAVIATNTLTLVTETSYIWPTPTIGHYIEINDDGVRRQITAIGDATTRTITFSPSVTSPVCGRETDCKGVRVVGRASSDVYTDSYTLQADSLSKDAGLFVAGVHCALADDNGGSGSTGCVHWSGLSPDLGYMEYGGAVIPPVIGNRWRIRAVVQP